MDGLSLKITPVVVTLIAAVVMGVFSSVALIWGSAYPLWLRLIPGILFILGAATLGAFSIIPYRKNHTTWKPGKPEQAKILIVGGIYRYTRNPMYLALLLFLAGWGFILGNSLSFIVLPLFVYYITQFQIYPEERALQKKFGEQYNRYFNNVPRWM